MTAPRSVFGRAMRLLAAFSAGTPELPLTALAARSGLPLTTAHRLCAQLEREGVLERLPDGRYRVGLRLWELGMLAPRAHGLREVALPFLEDLYEVTHENVQLVVLDPPEAVVVERLRARTAVRLVSRAGGRLPVHATSGGLVLLAHADPATVASVLAAPLRRYTAATLTTEPEIRAALALARRQGYLELHEHVTPGAVSIAAPILVRRQAVAAVSVVGEPSADARALIPALLTTTRGIARALGAEPAASLREA
ncbi:IclR family transcriptional regulator [Amnibacterium sp. CER49]|uniref:IclR family transcriptional regulator n=1 Tax=Amnibacterium sp. CER49 TaxID=3039161 RepID=UPI00244B8490|nr:IclR family transcriptional regulator [Amnibacterium sp. CER49]MDH2443181.1 IclR family transcriptional regulator [Amnibacterium sp. CER49]